MTPKSQWNSSLSIQCCLLDPYGWIKVVHSCLLCPCGCWWPQGNCADSWDPSLIFWLKFCWKPTPHDTKEPMKLFLVHTMLFVVSIWKNKSGSFLFVMSLWLLVAARKLCWQLGSITDFLTQVKVLMKTNPARHQRANETLPCRYNAVCWIHMEE
jgi:hypothetical protein